MIKYISTRGDKQKYTFSQVLLKGIADDGGLFVPEKIPFFPLNHIKQLVGKPYWRVAKFVFDLFETDFFEKEIETVVQKAYGENFDTPKIAPLVHMQKNQYLLELWHGPTAAFKDIALQCMPFFFEKAIKKHTPDKNYLVLVATSGDTGKAALEGYKNKKNIRVLVFYPEDGVSYLQELSMITQEEKNVDVIRVNGSFDDCQKMVKDIFNDRIFSQKLLNNNQTMLSSANSINWGRLLPQIVYHINAYVQLIEQKKIQFGDLIDVAVPTGNFGNILAAFIAKKMGLPIKKLICASNDNNALTQFLLSGILDTKNRSIIPTVSPAIDILMPNNIERLLYFTTKDAQKVSLWMEELNNKGLLKIDEKTKKTLAREFFAGWVSNSDCLKNIKDVFSQTGYLMDPHTSVAQKVASMYTSSESRQKADEPKSIPLMICSTAHPAKFSKSVYTALFGSPKENFDEFKMLDKIEKVCKISTPKNITKLKKKPVIHKIQIAPYKDIAEKTIEKYIIMHV